MVTMTVDIAIFGNRRCCDSHQFELTWDCILIIKSNMRNIHGKMVGFRIAIGRISLLRLMMLPMNYDPRIILKLDDAVIDEKWLSDTIIVEQTVFDAPIRRH